MSAIKTLSVIIEWENAKLSELERAERMLSQLGRQMEEAAKKRGFTAELIVLYDSDAIEENVPATAVSKNIPADRWPGAIRIVPAAHQRYYEQKNTGAQLSNADVLVFLDSDVVPEDGWLEGLLSAMDDPKVQFVGGETYHAIDTFYDRIFAGFWTFNVRKKPHGIYTWKNFYANNFAVRREVFLQNRFPDAPSYRGQCSALARLLKQRGITIYRQSAAFVSHPPPIGARTFMARAICQGYDAVYWKGLSPLQRLRRSNPISSLLRMIRLWGSVVVRVTTRAGAIGLGPLGWLAAIGTGFAYYFFKFWGEVVAFFAPGIIKNNLAV